MLKLIGKAMGKNISSGRDVLRSALDSAGYSDEYDDGEEEHDNIGDIVYVQAAD